VAEHDRDGAVVWAGEGKSGATLVGRCYGVLPGRAAWCRSALPGSTLPSSLQVGTNRTAD
jgi:hypothetical protein